MEEQVNEEAAPQLTSKPIKKRVVVQDDRDRDRDDYDHFDRDSHRRKSPSASSSEESKAHRELMSYLSGKGIDISREVEKYRVHVKLPKNERHGENHRSSSVITYSSPDGETYSSRGAVLDAIKASKNRNSSSQSPARSEIYASSQRKYNAFIRDGLPIDVDGIKVISFGTIDSGNSSFHSSVEICPVGFKAEMSLPLEHSRNQFSKVVCEILSRSEQPEFRITVPSSGKVYNGQTEGSVWRKVLTYIEI
jgi:hypothetical protein